MKDTTLTYSEIESLRAETIPPRKAQEPTAAEKARYIAVHKSEGCYLNLDGYYGYLENGYYLSLEMKANGRDIHPTCSEIIDGYVVPIFLEKAKQAGLKVPQYYITNSYFEPPVVVDSINPFMTRRSVVLKTRHQERIAKSLTRNFTYAICCQELPAGSRIGNFRSILGWSTKPRYIELSQSVWQVFRIPLVTVRTLILPDGEIMLSGLLPLPFNRLTPRERRYIEGQVEWQI